MDVSVCVHSRLVAAAEERRIRELETFGTREWAIASVCVNGTLFCPMVHVCPRDHKGQSSEVLSNTCSKCYRNQNRISPGAVILGSLGFCSGKRAVSKLLCSSLQGLRLCACVWNGEKQNSGSWWFFRLPGVGKRGYRASSVGCLALAYRWGPASPRRMWLRDRDAPDHGGSSLTFAGSHHGDRGLQPVQPPSL